MAFQDTVQDLLERFEGKGGRWAFVALGVLILLRLKLVLFAAALPLLAYWHYQSQEQEQEQPQADDAATRQPSVKASGAVDDDAPWPEDDKDLDDDDLDAEPLPSATDPYDQAFWGPTEQSPARPGPTRSQEAGRNGHDLLTGLDASPVGADDAGGSRRRLEGVAWGDLEETKSPKPMKAGADVWDSAGDDAMLMQLSGTSGNPKGRPADDGFGDFGLGSSMKDDLDMDLLGGGRMGGLGDDLLSSSLSFGDDDFLGGGFGGGKGKGKGKSKGKDGKGKDPMAPREADPKQVFVANVGDMEEEEIRELFQAVGCIERLKVLRNPEGGSKGVCFVTFSSTDEAESALKMHGQPLDERSGGRNLVVRMAHGGNKGEKGDSKGGGRFDRDGGGMMDRDREFTGAERFGAVSSGDGRFDRESRPKGKGKKGKGGGKDEINEILEEVTADNEGPLRAGDFDFAAKRFLSELRQRDRTDSSHRMQEALDMVVKYTCAKDRDSVRNWRAYVFTLLQKFDPGLWDELRERDAERRRDKGLGRGRDDRD